MRQVAKAMNAPMGSYWWWMAQLERLILPRTGGVLCNSKYTQSVVGPCARRTWLVPNALRREFFHTPLAARSAPARPLLLNIGTILPYKRQLELLEIAARLQRDGSNFELQFVGAVNPKIHYARTFLERINSPNYRDFARHVTIDSMAELIASMDKASALVHIPSEEAFGLVIAEALSRNLKFFGTDTGGIPDIAGGTDAAELFQLEDENGLGQAIARWLEAGCPRPHSAASEMKRRYHPETIAARHVEIYNSLLNIDYSR
jgi:glycosyltransferase involved in cell wall biosynthesis